MLGKVNNTVHIKIHMQQFFLYDSWGGLVKRQARFAIYVF